MLLITVAISTQVARAAFPGTAPLSRCFSVAASWTVTEERPIQITGRALWRAGTVRTWSRCAPGINYSAQGNESRQIKQWLASGSRSKTTAKELSQFVVGHTVPSLEQEAARLDEKIMQRSSFNHIWYLEMC